MEISQAAPRYRALSSPEAVPPALLPPPGSDVVTSPSSLLRKRSQEAQDDEDSIQLLDEAQALELVEFDPSVEPKDAWSPPPAMTSFLEKHFHRSLEEGERERPL